METIEETMESRIEQIVRPQLKFLPEGEKIGISRNLGELGLDSLASISLLYDLESAFGVSIPDDMLDENTFLSIGNLKAVLVQVARG